MSTTGIFIRRTAIVALALSTTIALSAGAALAQSTGGGGGGGTGGGGDGGGPNSVYECIGAQCVNIYELYEDRECTDPRRRLSLEERRTCMSNSNHRNAGNR